MMTKKARCAFWDFCLGPCDCKEPFAERLLDVTPACFKREDVEPEQSKEPFMPAPLVDVDVIRHHHALAWDCGGGPRESALILVMCDEIEQLRAELDDCEQEIVRRIDTATKRDKQGKQLRRECETTHLENIQLRDELRGHLAQVQAMHCTGDDDTDAEDLIPEATMKLHELEIRHLQDAGRTILFRLVDPQPTRSPLGKPGDTIDTTDGLTLRIASASIVELKPLMSDDTAGWHWRVCVEVAE